MWQVGVLVVITVYILVALCTGIATKITREIVKEEISIPVKRAKHVVGLVLGIYLIPLLGLAICMACYPNVMGLVILSILFSIFPVTKHIIIPLTDKKYITLKRKELGKYE